MARKKRKKKEEEISFKIPEFDEPEFMRKELVGAKAAMATIVLAFGVAAVSYLLTIGGVAYLAPLVGFGALFGLRYFYPALNLDMTRFDRRTWLGNGAIYLFSWLAFWVLLLNPPFLDISPPVVHTIQIPGASPENLTVERQAILILGSATSFTLRALVSDNIRVAQVEVEVQTNGGSVSLPLALGVEPGWWETTVPDVLPDTLYVLQIRALDHQGLATDHPPITVVTS